jgi:hypothetical protein
MHTTQCVPFIDDSASVIDPGLHTAHAEVDMLLNCPAAHAVQFVPPGVAKVSVTQPPWHRAHGTIDAAL